MTLYRFYFAKGWPVTFACEQSSAMKWAQRFARMAGTTVERIEPIRQLTEQLRLT